MPSVLDQHYFETNMICTKCKHTYDEILDKQLHCGKVRCNECTLLRQCGGDPPVCEECADYKKQQSFSNKATNVDLTEASIKKWDPVAQYNYSAADWADLYQQKPKLPK